MTEVSLLRLYLLRALYLAIAGLEGAQIWPIIIHHAQSGKVWELMHGVAFCMLGALTAVAVLGIRYPLQMLPLLFFEIVWKLIWLIAVAVPLGLAHKIDADTMQTVIACLMVAIVIVIIPWFYVFANYVKKPGDRWWPAPSSTRS
jgi:hypothetical protein